MLTSSILRHQTNPLGQRSLLVSSVQQQPSRLFDRHTLELDHITRSELPQTIEIGGDDMRDVRVAPHGSTRDTQHDRLPPGNLHGAG